MPSLCSTKPTVNDSHRPLVLKSVAKLREVTLHTKFSQLQRINTPQRSFSSPSHLSTQQQSHQPHHHSTTTISIQLLNSSPASSSASTWAAPHLSQLTARAASRRAHSSFQQPPHQHHWSSPKRDNRNNKRNSSINHLLPNTLPPSLPFLALHPSLPFPANSVRKFSPSPSISAPKSTRPPLTGQFTRSSRPQLSPVAADECYAKTSSRGFSTPFLCEHGQMKCGEYVVF